MVYNKIKPNPVLYLQKGIITNGERAGIISASGVSGLPAPVPQVFCPRTRDFPLACFPTDQSDQGVSVRVLTSWVFPSSDQGHCLS